MIKAIIFDVDGVLLDSFEANLKFYQDLMVHSGHRPPTREEYSAFFHLTLWDSIKELTGLTAEADVRKIWEMAKNQVVAYPLELTKAPNQAAAVVASLSQRYLLGIVTSRIRVSIYEDPKLAAIEKYFSVTVAYEDIVRPKPHPEALLLAAQRLAIQPGEAVYIGDVANDMKAARAAGMKAIVYSKDKLAEADACTSLFEELPDLIDAL